MRKIVIVQQYVPLYRVRFFEMLSEALRLHHIQLVVAAAKPRGVLAQRQDSADTDWIERIVEYRIDFLGRSLILGGSRPVWKDADAVILPLQGSSVDAYRAIFGANRQHQKIGLWGHVKSYVNDPHPIDAAAERWMMKKADRIFAYTNGGADYARNAGINPAKITTVMNSVDTIALETANSGVSRRDELDFLTGHRLLGKKVVSYIGGLDSSKRIDLLVESLDVLWSMNKDIVLLVGGRGRDEALLRKAVDRGQCVFLGHVDDRTKSIMGRVSKAITIPGRIGLVAVEALVLGLPIVSTKWPFHAPEAEYLAEGETLFSSEQDATSYAHLIAKVVDSDLTASRSNMRRGYPSLTGMVNNYCDGIVSMLS